jgi:hypothetical protein
MNSRVDRVSETIPVPEVWPNLRIPLPIRPVFVEVVSPIGSDVLRAVLQRITAASGPQENPMTDPNAHPKSPAPTAHKQRAANDVVLSEREYTYEELQAMVDEIEASLAAAA